MKCADFQELVEDYSAGSLDHELSAGIQLHLGECADCLALLERVQAEERLYREYGKTVASDLKVNPEMWLQIRSKLEGAGVIPPEPDGTFQPERRSSWWFPSSGWRAWTRQLALAALLIVISIAGTLLAVRHHSRGGGASEVQPPGISPVAGSGGERAAPLAVSPVSEEDTRSLEAAVRALQRAERDYLEAIHILSDIVENRKPALEARMVKELEKNLRSLDASIESTRKAYYSHPTDPYLAQHMLTAYRQKVELLQELAT